jgi:serine protease AprX
VADDDNRRKRRTKRTGEKPSVAEKEPGGEQFPIPADLVEHILLGPADDRRVLQDSPVLGDVWLAYAADPASIQDLLITPHRSATAAEVAGQISEEVKRIRSGTDRQNKSANIAYLQGIVAARLYFNEVLRILVPLTQWWQQRKVADKLEEDDAEAIRERMRRLLKPDRFSAAHMQIRGESTGLAYEDFSALDRYIALAGLILWVGGQTRPGARLQPIDIEKVFRRYDPHIDDIVNGMLELYQTIKADIVEFKASVERQRSRERSEDEGEENALIFQVSLNRTASPALDKSVPAVKADAARRLFDIKCNKIVWAVLDSGIDGTHDAFISRDGEKKPKPRVRKTFDFTNIREIVSSDNADLSDDGLDRLLDRVLAHNNIDRNEARERLKVIANCAKEKRPTNWDVVEELITLSDPPKPVSLHGTHVAGIIGAAPVGTNLGGMCHDIRLHDFRVLGKTLEDTEFAVIAALQYIRYVNERQSYITIHGANLSLSIPHNVRNYACGRTPVCIECERLVDNGVVVVAAAGNRGHQKFETKEGVFESYAAFSITDPGNGDGVITVGATHGNWPHTYGISFFSSRGPTGDGRLKPDLVAPGERIQSTVPENQWGPESGTSMAAPHVSGAAAMLMARYPELIGQPRRIKRILCDTATDLGRERSFQGYGMLDVLRAFQSI